MNLSTYFVAAFITFFIFIGQARAELIDNSSIRYSELADETVFFEVTPEHAKEVIEPQIDFGASLDCYNNKEIVIQLTDYALDHIHYNLVMTKELDYADYSTGKIYIGTPNGIPEGMIFITEVSVKQRFFRKQKYMVGFVIPSVKGFKANEIVYFSYPK